ncbi:hypothetical protein GTQ40_12230 [Flavobacteriaceae bacterium R38]|nr:hypothetical protein [Flavobacteriaceae bacterium R38]
MMKDEHIIDLLVDYLDGSLSKDLKKEVDAHLDKCEACKEELTQLKTVFRAIEEEKDVEIPKSLKTGFYEILDQEIAESNKIISIQNNRNSFGKTFLKIAAGLTLLLMSYTFGKYQGNLSSEKEIAAVNSKNQEIKQLAMLSFMENESASKRIQGVNYVEEFTMPDEEIVNALIKRLEIDENTNVRLAAVEALEKFTSSEKVKKALIEALGYEKDATVQITIIQILVSIQEKKAAEPMKKLLELEDTEAFVKEQIQELLPTFM